MDAMNGREMGSGMHVPHAYSERSDVAMRLFGCHLFQLARFMQKLILSDRLHALERSNRGIFQPRIDANEDGLPVASRPQGQLATVKCGGEACSGALRASIHVKSPKLLHLLFLSRPGLRAS
jgi:hypothetical protein